jgi:NADPH-dependent ferric siderophore reductase
MSDKMPSRGFQGAVLKLLRAGDYRLTVTGRRELTPHYLRLSFDGGGLLTDRPLHPTMWIRMGSPMAKSSISAATPWVACDNRTTREVAKVFREDYKIPRKSIKAQAYWVA